MVLIGWLALAHQPAMFGALLHPLSALARSQSGFQIGSPHSPLSLSLKSKTFAWPKADLEKISDARDLARRAYDEREKLFTSRWIIH